jgi:hypothetical protein
MGCGYVSYIKGKRRKSGGGEETEIFQRNVLKVIVISQLFPCHDATVPCEKSHSWFPRNSPLLHSAIRLAGMVYKTGYGTAGGINDHILIKVHKIIAL